MLIKVTDFLFLSKRFNFLIHLFLNNRRIVPQYVFAYDLPLLYNNTQ